MQRVRAREAFRAVHNSLVLSYEAGEIIEGDIAQYLTETGSPVESVDVEVRRPAPYASKPDWVDYAVAQGMDRDKAEALTKADLVNL